MRTFFFLEKLETIFEDFFFLEKLELSRGGNISKAGCFDTPVLKVLRELKDLMGS